MEERARIQNKTEEYMLYGGFPECVEKPEKKDYLLSVYQKIYLSDIATRNKAENDYALRLMLRKQAESIMQPISFTRLKDMVASIGTRISTNTIINYTEYAKDAFLILPIKNFANHFTERETNRKYYFIDNGIISLLTFNNHAALLENMVALALLRKYGLDDRVFFYHHNLEVDFVVPDQELAIQVCYQLGDIAGDTFKRETQALLKLCKRLSYSNLLIITFNEEKEIEIGGKLIRVLPIWKIPILDYLAPFSSK